MTRAASTLPPLQSIIGPRPSAQAAPRAAGYMLTEIIGILPLMVVALTLLTTTTAVVLRGYRRSAEIANEYAAIDGLLEQLRKDTRIATSAEWATADGDIRSVTLHTGSGSIRYRFEPDRACREVLATDAAHHGRRCWNLQNGSMVVSSPVGQAQVERGESDPLATAAERISLLTVQIHWRGRSKSEVDPARRFEATYFVGRGYQQ
ncbi:MAG: hypothetical protein ACYSVY_05730 [Planctomycetota bacterium]